MYFPATFYQVILRYLLTNFIVVVSACCEHFFQHSRVVNSCAVPLYLCLSAEYYYLARCHYWTSCSCFDAGVIFWMARTWLQESLKTNSALFLMLKYLPAQANTKLKISVAEFFTYHLLFKKQHPFVNVEGYVAGNAWIVYIYAFPVASLTNLAKFYAGKHLRIYKRLVHVLF